ncbi:hypothetical protein, partial [Mycobacteroides abscessus]|uniref:hypothetical protein n=1 Tax=Mycobacteroides abscessus TaxID=36809 RepID=UPI001A95720B
LPNVKGAPAEVGGGTLYVEMTYRHTSPGQIGLRMSFHRTSRPTEGLQFCIPFDVFGALHARSLT